MLNSFVSDKTILFWAVSLFVLNRFRMNCEPVLCLFWTVSLFILSRFNVHDSCLSVTLKSMPWCQEPSLMPPPWPKDHACFRTTCHGVTLNFMPWCEAHLFLLKRSLFVDAFHYFSKRFTICFKALHYLVRGVSRNWRQLLFNIFCFYFRS